MALSREWKIALVVAAIIVAVIAIWIVGYSIFNLGESVPGTGTGEIGTTE